MPHYVFNHDVDVMPKRLLEEDHWDDFEQPFRKIGSHVQFLCQTEKEVNAVSEKLLKDTEIMSYQTSGLSIEDIYFYYLVNEDPDALGLDEQF